MIDHNRPALDTERIKSRLRNELSIRPQHSEEIQQYVSDFSRNILLSGPAGSGKTTLAEDLMQELRDQYVVLPFSPLLYGGIQTPPAKILTNFLSDMLVSYNPANPRVKRMVTHLAAAAEKVLDGVPGITADLTGSGLKVSANAANVKSLLRGVYSHLLPAGKEIAKYVIEDLVCHPEGAPTMLSERIMTQPDHPLFLRILVWSLYSQIVDRQFALSQGVQQEKKLGVLVVVDDLDRCRPEQAMAIMDGLFRYFLFWGKGIAPPLRTAARHLIQQGTLPMQEKTVSSSCSSAPSLVPMNSLWLVDGSVMEQMFRKEYAGIPDFSIDTYLLQTFHARINMPLMTDTIQEVPILWKNKMLQSAPFKTRNNQDDLCRLLSRSLDYNMLKNIRLYSRLIDNCLLYWTQYCDKTSDALPNDDERVYEARAILLGLGFFEFRNQVVLHTAWWPPFVNSLNSASYTAMATASHHVFRFASDYNLLTLLSDLGAIRYQTDNHPHCWESIPAGQEHLCKMSIALLQHGF
ncbi:MAG: P-loop NTPase fold protein [Magnetococcus sp. DMHC-8]